MPVQTQTKQPESDSETRGVLRYWYSAIKFATRTTFEGKPTTWLRRLLLFMLTLVIVRYTMGSVQMTEELNLGIAFGVAAVAFIGLSLLWNLIATPLRMHRNMTEYYKSRISKLERAKSRAEADADYAIADADYAIADADYAIEELQKRPVSRLELHEPKVSTRPLAYKGKSYDVYTVSIPISNNPSERTVKARALNTIASLEFLDSEGTLLFKIQGQWNEKPQNALPEARRMDFPATGEEHLLDILLKYPEDDYCYPLNHESSEYEGWCATSRKILNGSMIDVVLVCEGAKWDTVGTFRLLLSRGGKPRLRHLYTDQF